MAIRKYKPTTPGRRGASVSDFAEITRDHPEKSLVRPLHGKGGRNAHGRITTRHKGGGHKRAYRVIDFRRNDKDGVNAKVAHIEYDPNRTANIALLHYLDGEKRYIIAPGGLSQGDVVESGANADLKPGNNLPMETWDDRKDPHSKAPDMIIAGPAIDILVRVPGRAEPLPDNVWIAPLRRRRDSRRRRRQVTGREREHPPDKKLRRPGRERHGPSGLQNAQHFADRDFRPGCKDMSELAQDNVERRVAKWQLLDISFVPINFDSCNARILPRPFQQLGREIEPSYLCAHPRRSDGHHAGPASHVKHPLAGPDGGKFHQASGRNAGLSLECYPALSVASRRSRRVRSEPQRLRLLFRVAAGSGPDSLHYSRPTAVMSRS